MPEILRTITGLEAEVSVSKALAQLMELCKRNSESDADTPARYTYFHSSQMPAVTLPNYIDTIHRRCRIGRDGVVLAIILVYRYCEAVSMKPSLLSVHRLCLTAALLAAKAHHDLHCSNRSFADAGGIPLAELNQLEVRMANGVGFDFNISMDEIKAVGAGAWPIPAQCDTETTSTTFHVAYVTPCLAPPPPFQDASGRCDVKPLMEISKEDPSTHPMPTPRVSPNDSPQSAPVSDP